MHPFTTTLGKPLHAARGRPRRCWPPRPSELGTRAHLVAHRELSGDDRPSRFAAYVCCQTISNKAAGNSRPRQRSSATRSNTVSSQHAEHAGRCLRCRFPTILSTRRQGRMAMTQDDLRLWSLVYAWATLGTWITITRSSCLIPRRIRFSRNATVRMRSAVPDGRPPPLPLRGVAPHRHRRWLRARVIHGHADGAWALSDRRRQHASREPQYGMLEAEAMSRFAPTATARRGEI